MIFQIEWRITFFISCKQLSLSYAILIDVLSTSVPDENLTKCTLLVQRSLQALIDYHKMLFPPHVIHQTKHARESRYDHESTKYYQAFFFFFYERKQNISSLHKIICSLVSLFLLYIMKVVEPANFLQCLITSSVLVS